MSKLFGMPSCKIHRAHLMKPARIFGQYIWLINTLRRYRSMTLGQLNRKWIDDEVADGNPLSRSTFNRHRDAILDMFGVIIDCEPNNGYRYHIANPEVLCGDTIERWLLSTLTVEGVLSDCASIKDRILLEEVPAGEEYLPLIIKAIKTGKNVRMGYRRFGTDGYETTVSPYALKLFHQRWYMLAYTGKWIATYSLDRMTSLTITEESFKMLEDFSPEVYFSEYFGVLTDESVPMAHVVIRAYGQAANYLRTLPLHVSQVEINTTEDFADFALDIRPTYDFQEQLMHYTSRIEVLEPADLRQQMKEEIMAMSNNYL